MISFNANMSIIIHLECAMVKLVLNRSDFLCCFLTGGYQFANCLRLIHLTKLFSFLFKKTTHLKEILLGKKLKILKLNQLNLISSSGPELRNPTSSQGSKKGKNNLLLWWIQRNHIRGIPTTPEEAKLNEGKGYKIE
jgi:hypothetical protein